MAGRSVVDGAAPLHMTVMNPLYLYDDEIERLRAALRSIHFDRFSMTLDHFHTNETRALLNACAHPAFTALCWDVDKAALKTGIVPRTKPRPHVTLSTRVNASAMPSVRTAIEWPFDEVCLLWSQLTVEVGRRQYVVLERHAADSRRWQAAQLGFSF